MLTIGSIGRTMAAAAMGLYAGAFASEPAQAQRGGSVRDGVYYSPDRHYQDHRGPGGSNRPPRWSPRAPGQGGHYQDHRGDRPTGPRSPGYRNPYMPGTTATPPRGPTVNSSGHHAAPRMAPMGGGGGGRSGRR